MTNIVTEMTVQQGQDIDNDIFWGVVSEKMGGTRGRQQCRIKWCVEVLTRAPFAISNEESPITGRIL